MLDNPPFSILTRICDFYLDHGISFFLFAPSLTAFSGRKTLMELNHIICDCKIIYENGAVVKTSFVTNCTTGIVAQTAPDLTRLINNKTRELKRRTKQLPKYSYPDHVVTAAMMQKYAEYGVNLTIKKSDCIPISTLDAQKSVGKAIYGGGLLLSEKAAAQKAAAEKAAVAEKPPCIWELSERERQIVRKLSRN